MSNTTPRWLPAILLVTIVLLMLLSLSLGSVALPWQNLLRELWQGQASVNTIIVTEIRLPRALLALLLMVSTPVWAAEPKELTWSEMIPPDAAPEVPDTAPMHDLSQLGNLDPEAAPAAQQSMPNAPVVPALDGQNIRLPGYIVPLEVNEEGRTTEFLLVPYFGAMAMSLTRWTAWN